MDGYTDIQMYRVKHFHYGKEGRVRKISATAAIMTYFVVGLAAQVNAHFGVLVPSDDIIAQQDSKTITLDVKFIHPMEGDYMEMEKPKKFGVIIRGYKIKRPGDYTFYVEMKPYWEPAEDSYIIHYTKVCVHALGLEQGWDDEVGLETEIVPLTRPYGLWTGNLFTAVVKIKGKPVPYAQVEVEYYDEEEAIQPPADPYITQMVKTDKNGVFSYAMPRAGWWAFAALNEASWTTKRPDGKDKSIEIGAVYWVRTRDMK